MSDAREARPGSANPAVAEAIAEVADRVVAQRDEALATVETVNEALVTASAESALERRLAAIEKETEAWRSREETLSGLMGRLTSLEAMEARRMEALALAEAKAAEAEALAKAKEASSISERSPRPDAARAVPVSTEELTMKATEPPAPSPSPSPGPRRPMRRLL